MKIVFESKGCVVCLFMGFIFVLNSEQQQAQNNMYLEEELGTIFSNLAITR